ncbi:MAG: methyltransferase domain-containing protein [Pseudomonadota bacterium]
MTLMSRFDELIATALAQSLSGWDFAFVDGRLTETELPWNYRKLVRQRIPNVQSLLDMCTGGGEFLDGFKSLPASTYATEGYAPNVEVARQRLAARGVEVIAVNSDDQLPLPDDAFDLVINRHGAYSPAELSRITQAGGLFLTQQVGSANASDINRLLDAPSPSVPAWRLERAIEYLDASGFDIVQQAETFPVMSFADVGALVFYLRAIPWQVPDFEPEIYRTQLLALHDQISAEGSLEVRAHRFLIEAIRR